MRVLIIGVGGAGAMAAWRLARNGQDVVALEQFALDHDRGSSYGDSRIVRRVYADALYTRLMGDAYALWDELNAAASAFDSEPLFVPSGGVFCGPADHPHLVTARAALEASGVPFEALNDAECRKRFPAFVLRPEEIALYEPSMGYARASRCVRAVARLAREAGATIVENAPVTDIAPLAGGGVSVTTASGNRYEADRLVLTAGAWTQNLLAPFGVTLPLVVTRQVYAHLDPESRYTDFVPGRFPAWIDAPTNMYGFPLLGDTPGVKLASHDQGQPTTPDTTDRSVHESERQALRDYAQRRMPALGPNMLYEKVCLYTNTPDEDFILDAIPGLPDGFVISACSGHGFKFAPLIGQIAADLATTGATSYDLSRFRLARFTPSAQT